MNHEDLILGLKCLGYAAALSALSSYLTWRRCRGFAKRAERAAWTQAEKLQRARAIQDRRDSMRLF